jgi:hypothetical protein
VRNPCLDAVAAELERAGIYDYTVGRDRRHVHVRWIHGGEVRLVVVSRTPSGPGAPHSARGDVRRLLRQDGVYL